MLTYFAYWNQSPAAAWGSAAHLALFLRHRRTRSDRSRKSRDGTIYLTLIALEPDGRHGQNAFAICGFSSVVCLVPSVPTAILSVLTAFQAMLISDLDICGCGTLCAGLSAISLFETNFRLPEEQYSGPSGHVFELPGFR